ncbi:hypothetical protein I6E68_09390 [Salinibacterium sp. NSLL150]|uniref:hypothetical protein n=1 Tax=unclassified Salinibacterium TaxID=2632331 RepID=UPI0018CED22D|nr:MULTISPECIES: hypothetical protein [unclassified Salinibacterium]MBH0099352.1 hypothetical protein [Salinibacterium sp. NSLL35]MBH0102106.1 hypothetical protein [Salinibacterium sp. NSLL150]MBH0104866.1 hypothetical protein [Salinibacterium sp. NSLL16]MBH0107626.1 hypothetical protein [Salinibacterium sp. NSLL17]
METVHGTYGMTSESYPPAFTPLVEPNQLLEAGTEPLQPESPMTSPFAESFATLTEEEWEGQALEDLASEMEDEQFSAAVDSLVNEAARRHLNAMSGWREAEGGSALAQSDVEQWMESIVSEAEYMIDELEREHDGQSLEWFSELELENELFGAAEYEDNAGNPLDSQELFFKALRRKFKKVVSFAKKAIKKGVKFIGNLNPLKRIFAAIKKAVRPLLKRVLRRVLGKLPPPLRAVAVRVAKRLGIKTEVSELTEAEAFDLDVAGELFAPAFNTEGDFEHESEYEGAPGGDAYEADVATLDRARDRLAHQLAEMESGQTPLAEMEQFLPAVMPLLKIGVKIVGRKRVVGVVAKALSVVMAPLVGSQAAKLLSRYIADSGLKLIGFEAESAANDPTLGTSALVAAAEAAVAHVATLDESVLDDDRLLEGEVQAAFAEAAAQHIPAALLRPEFVDPSAEGGVWVSMPRATAPVFRYKKFSRVIPLRVHKSLAQSVRFTNGETLESRMLEAGVEEWPAEGELELYEFLPGGEVGHLTEYESDGEASTADEFDEFSEEVAGMLARNRRLGSNARGRGSPRRVFRIKVAGKRLRKRSPFSVRLDLSSPRPEIRLLLRVGEGNAHRMARMLDARQLTEVVKVARSVFGETLTDALAARLVHMTKRRQIMMPDGSTKKLAGVLVTGAMTAFSKQLPGMASTLSAAAKDAASGVTLMVTFRFADKAALIAASPAEPTLSIKAGYHRA